APRSGAGCWRNTAPGNTRCEKKATFRPAAMPGDSRYRGCLMPCSLPLLPQLELGSEQNYTRKIGSEQNYSRIFVLTPIYYCSDPNLLLSALQDDMGGLLSWNMLGVAITETGHIDAVEEMLSRAEKYRRDRDVHLVDEPRAQVLPDGA